MVKCILTEAKVIVNTTFNQDGMLNAIFPIDAPEIHIKNVRRLLVECFTPANFWGIIDCWKKECERFGFNPYYIFDVDLIFPRPFRTYLGLDKINNNTKKCYKESKLKIDLVGDISVGACIANNAVNNMDKINDVFHTIIIYTNSVN